MASKQAIESSDHIDAVVYVDVGALIGKLLKNRKDRVSVIQGDDLAIQAEADSEEQPIQ